LKTVTKQEIYDDNLLGKSVKEAVEVGFLPEVVKYRMLDNII